MSLKSFGRDELLTVGEALDIAEDATGNFYKFSDRQWRRHRYEVKTLNSLHETEILDHAFALLHKGVCMGQETEVRIRFQDLFFICLQDHQILNAMMRDVRLCLRPLLVYIFTHELVHIVRFCSHLQRFDATDEERAREEEIVHEISHRILGRLALTELGYVLRSYQGHRVSERLIG